MTREEAIAAHRKMWRWIADETERRERAVHKYDYFDATGIPEDERPFRYCYCCNYAISCALCPIEWPTGQCIDGGLYSQWQQETEFSNGDWAKAAALARQIAELPEKEDANNETD